MLEIWKDKKANQVNPEAAILSMWTGTVVGIVCGIIFIVGFLKYGNSYYTSDSVGIGIVLLIVYLVGPLLCGLITLIVISSTTYPFFKRRVLARECSDQQKEEKTHA